MPDLRRDVKLGELAGLIALRDVLAGSIVAGTTSASERAALSARLMTCLERIAKLERAQARGSRVTDIANAREARRAGAAGAKSPRRSSVHGGARGG